MLGSLRRILAGPSEPPAAPPSPEAFIELDEGDSIRGYRAAHPDRVAAIDAATESVLELLPGADLDELARHHVALRGYDWRGYLSASRYRIQMIDGLLLSLGSTGGRLIDSGAYFGNFALAFARLGYRVAACDAYADYRGALDPWRALLERSGVAVVDPGDFSGGIPVESGAFDVALSCGVIEHIPHSPRAYLLELRRALAPGGLVVVETPNLAYQHKRDLLASGRSVFPPIESQFDSDPPFAGHHREYTGSELEWMLARVGLEPVRTAYYDYSHLSLTEIDDGTAAALRRRRADPTSQELVIAIGRAPGAS